MKRSNLLLPQVISTVAWELHTRHLSSTRPLHMSQFDRLFKAVLLLGLGILLIDKISSIRRQKDVPTERDLSDEAAIRNSVPSSEQQSWNRWSLLSAFAGWYSGAIDTRGPDTMRLSRLRMTVAEWFAAIALRFKSQQPSINTASTGPAEPMNGLAFKKQSVSDERTYRKVQINGIDVAYHNPFAIRKLRGVVLLLHGCQQEASDWFELPEHRHIAAQMLRRRLALLAVTSANRVTGCWSTRYPSWQNDDVARVANATMQWMSDFSISPHIPLHGIGVSSGGTMLSVLSGSDSFPNLVSQALYISPGNHRAFRKANESYPNTLFVHVLTDHYYASPSAVASARKTLLKRNVGLVGELLLPKIHLTPLTLHEREPRFSVETSRKIFAAAQREGGNIERAVRTSTEQTVASLWNNRESRRAARQIIRVVNGQHEVCAAHADKVAEWLVSNGRRKAAASTLSWHGLSLHWKQDGSSNVETSSQSA